ncbi:dTMP kinase [Salinisphaera sp. USBA-960]|uniref:dTMP kinase n=1 Tax=Salinisphaera orenii TaxID=856731 RepID=UPI000DBE9F80|nr:dTMP kinase [Salifodinibacter halophilus]NNC25701.1 dTMP kinase [Salifodinibacter halophilus]
MTETNDREATPRGRFIALEGGEGVGKSTQVAEISAWLTARGYEVVTTREPGGTPLGDDIRGVLMTDYATTMPATSELSLVYAARAAHLAEVIEPALARGAWVVCDRFNDASYAYQGAGRGLGESTVDAFDRAVVGDRQPDLVFIFDLLPADGQARVELRDHRNRFDNQRLVFHEHVRRAYLARAEAAPERYCVVDANGSAEAVTTAVTEKLAEWVP